MSFAESFTALETLLPCLICPVCYHREREAVLRRDLEDRTVYRPFTASTVAIARVRSLSSTSWRQSSNCA